MPDPQNPGQPAEDAAPDATGIEPAAPADSMAAEPTAAATTAGAQAEAVTLEMPEPGGAPVLLEPVSPGPRPVRSRSRLRWGVAIGLVAVIAVLSATAFFVLAAGKSASNLVSFAPKDSLVYVEVRSDLPGDQGRKLADLMANFPGFADRAALDAKIGEAIDQQLGSAGSSWSFTKDVKPWLSGELAVAVPAASAASSADANRIPLFLLATKDPAAGLAFLKQVSADRPSEARTIGGLPFTVVGSGATAVAYGASGTTILIGNVEAVAAGLAAKEQGGLDTTDGYRAAQKSLPGDHLVFGYVNYRAVLQLMQASMPAATGIPAALMDQLTPPWMGFAVRAESAALVLEAATPNTGPRTPVAKTSQLASRLPGTTFLEIEQRDLGVVIGETLTLYRSIPTYKDALDSADEQARRALGNDIAGLTSWIGDAAFAVTRDNLVFSGGIVVQVTDAAAAKALATRLRGMIEPLAGTGSVRVREENFGSGTIVIYEPVEAGSAVPFLPGGTVQVAWSLQDDLLVIGLGPDFVKSVLQPTAGSTLADQPVYRAAMAEAGTPNTGQVFVDLASIVQLTDLVIPIGAPQVSKQYGEIKPFLAPFQAIAASSSMSGDVLVSRVVVTVK